MDKKLTQEELNGLSPRARKAYGQSNDMIQEIVEVPAAPTPLAEKQNKDFEFWGLCLIEFFKYFFDSL